MGIRARSGRSASLRRSRQRGALGLARFGSRPAARPRRCRWARRRSPCSPTSPSPARPTVESRIRAALPAFAPAARLPAASPTSLSSSRCRAGNVTVVAPLNATQSLWGVLLAAAFLGQRRGRRPSPRPGRGPRRRRRRPRGRDPLMRRQSLRGAPVGEVVRDLVERGPADALVRVDVLDDPLVHEEDLRPAAHVGVDRHGEDRVVVLAVDPVERVHPDLLELPRVDEAVAVRRGLDEHHRREVVEVPARRDLDQVGLLAAHERLHPLGGRLASSRSSSRSRPTRT